MSTNKFSDMRMANKAAGQLKGQEANLNFKITYEEAVEFIKETLGLPKYVKVVIEEMNQAAGEQKTLERLLREEFCQKIERHLAKDHGKIQAIKYARSVLNTGLAESKAFVDDFDIIKDSFLDERHKFNEKFDGNLV